MKNPALPLLLAVSLPPLAGCLGGSPPVQDTAPWAAAETPANSEPVLYARDGSPVTGSAVATEAAGTTRGLEGDGGSRLYLLELYQKAMDEKDQLVVEVETLQALVTKAEARANELTTRVQEADAKVAELEANQANLEQQGMDLASRLTTAQIRRLESEKLLLEAKIQDLEAAARVRGARAPMESGEAADESGKRR
jgi:hypothetical protein